MQYEENDEEQDKAGDYHVEFCGIINEKLWGFGAAGSIISDLSGIAAGEPNKNVSNHQTNHYAYH